LERPFEANTGNVKVGVTNLLRAHPERAERIKLALFEAVRDARATVAAFESRGENFDENISEYLVNSITALVILRDARAIPALLSGPGSAGMNPDFLADLCPEAVDAVIEKLRAPVRLSERAAAFIVLRQCTTRQALMRAHPDVLGKVRKALLAGLDDGDGNTRAEAAYALSTFRNDPEVRAKLSRLGATDPHISVEKRVGKEGRHATRSGKSPAGSWSLRTRRICFT
jgi:hypothetical protein